MYSAWGSQWCNCTTFVTIGKHTCALLLDLPALKCISDYCPAGMAPPHMET